MLFFEGKRGRRMEGKKSMLMLMKYYGGCKALFRNMLCRVIRGPIYKSSRAMRLSNQISNVMFGVCNNYPMILSPSSHLFPSIPSHFP
jgi:hypothetical protein